MGWAAMSWQSGYFAIFSCINWAVPAAVYVFRNASLADRRGSGVETALLDFRLSISIDNRFCRLRQRPGGGGSQGLAERLFLALALSFLYLAHV